MILWRKKQDIDSQPCNLERRGERVDVVERDIVLLNDGYKTLKGEEIDKLMQTKSSNFGKAGHLRPATMFRRWKKEEDIELSRWCLLDVWGSRGEIIPCTLMQDVLEVGHIHDSRCHFGDGRRWRRRDTHVSTSF